MAVTEILSPDGRKMYIISATGSHFRTVIYYK